MPNDYIDAVADCVEETLMLANDRIVTDAMLRFATMFAERCLDIAGPAFSSHYFLNRCGFCK